MSGTLSLLEQSGPKQSTFESAQNASKHLCEEHRHPYRYPECTSGIQRFRRTSLRDTGSFLFEACCFTSPLLLLTPPEATAVVASSRFALFRDHYRRASPRPSCCRSCSAESIRRTFQSSSACMARPRFQTIKPWKYASARMCQSFEYLTQCVSLRSRCRTCSSVSDIDQTASASDASLPLAYPCDLPG